MSRLIFVNGPPGSGKDQFTSDFVAFLEADGVACTTVVLSDIIKTRTHVIAGLAPDLLPRAFERVKDLPAAEFGGRTPREAYIAVSDSLRRIEGPGMFAKLLLPTIQRGLAEGVVVMPGVGFADEVAPIVAAIGPPRCLIVRFSGPFTDSRKPLNLPGVQEIETAPYRFAGVFDFAGLRILDEPTAQKQSEVYAVA